MQNLPLRSQKGFSLVELSIEVLPLRMVVAVEMSCNGAG